MQPYVPVGCVPCKQQRTITVHITEQSDSAYIGGMRADDGFKVLRSVDTKALVAAFRSDRQAMRRRSRRCVSQALRPDSDFSQSGQPLVLFLFPSEASSQSAPLPCRAAASRHYKSTLHALALPSSTIAD